ncbi:uncharacterized protein LOC126855710, partial [Cataglyphis hispanica]|uniref:uncharacterized protein LOC126855710 n=1 Tax=Cataglyphis hispanica TaxID=1086592 RepID=UPI00217FB7C2
MATITDLPDDVIFIILENKSISYEDIANFQSTCKRLQQITLSNKFWERKYYQSCPTAENKYNKTKQKKIFHQNNFKEKLKAGLYHVQKFQNYASLMSENNLTDIDKKQFEHHLRSTVQISMIYYLVRDEIERISAQKLYQLFPNLTREYYLKLTCHYLKQYRFIHKQVKLMSKLKTKFLLEKQLTIIAQYFQPHVSYWAIKTWLDEIAQTVLSRLMEKYPAHSIFSATSEQFSFWSDNNIADNFWNETESRQIIDVLEEYIFCDLVIYKLPRLMKILHLEE